MAHEEVDRDRILEIGPGVGIHSLPVASTLAPGEAAGFVFERRDGSWLSYFARFQPGPSSSG